MRDATTLRKVYTVSASDLRERPEHRRDEDGVWLEIVYNDLPSGDVIIMEYEDIAFTGDPELPEDFVKEEPEPETADVSDKFHNNPANNECETGIINDFEDVTTCKNVETPKETIREDKDNAHSLAKLVVDSADHVSTPHVSVPCHSFPKPAAIALGILCIGVAVFAVPKLIRTITHSKPSVISVDSKAGDITEKRLVGGAGGTTPEPEKTDSSGDQNDATQEPAYTPELIQDFHPHSVKSTRPGRMISMTQVNVNGKTLSNSSTYKPKKSISFPCGTEYTDVDGIVTFRGNNFRDDPTYGTANLKKDRLKGLWNYHTGSMTANGRTWSGNGWTGQPLMRRWTRQEKQAMNMYDWAKEKDSLVEVIYASLDGNVYFLDLKTGKPTRDVLTLGFTFKGAGALDPRGYPILYVGAGYDGANGKSRVFVVSLIDGSILYTFGNQDNFSLRGGLSYFDSSALVDAKTDTLIYPGENGILYLIHLGSKYDREKGTVSVKPDRIVKWRYQGKRSGQSKYWLGMEDSCVIYQGYLYIMDNGGHFMCLDLNTLKLVWVQDSLDDSNSTPVLSVEDGKAYLYASTSFHLGWRSSSSAKIPIWKIDAETGEIIWKTSYTCYSEEGVSGGVQSTIAVGRHNLADSIYVTVSKTGSHYGGVLACLDKASGKIRWEHKAGYAWSSPVCVYNADGTGRVLYCSSDGNMYLLDGRTGKELDRLSISTGCIEASPAVYENIAVVGTRACQIWGIKLY